jgi:hypothetical protein
VRSRGAVCGRLDWVCVTAQERPHAGVRALKRLPPCEDRPYAVGKPKICAMPMYRRDRACRRHGLGFGETHGRGRTTLPPGGLLHDLCRPMISPGS